MSDSLLFQFETSFSCVQKSALLSMDLKSVWALIQSRGFYSLRPAARIMSKVRSILPTHCQVERYSKGTGVRLRKQFLSFHKKEIEYRNFGKQSQRANQSAALKPI